VTHDGETTTPRNDLTQSTRLSRRAVVGLSGAAAVGLAAAGPAAAGAPRTVALPDGIRPEGITSGPGTTYYVGSLADGRLVTGELLEGTVGTLWPGMQGRALRGLQWDARSGLVWAAGNVGSEGHVWAVDGRTGAVVSDTLVPGALFLNDLVVTDAVVWVADSRVGGLWNTDPTTGATVEIPVRGGRRLTGGDGLELAGSTLYDVRGSGEGEVSVLRLVEGAGRWRAEWRGVRRNGTLDVPSTATVAGRWLWAVNARFGVASPETASYWISRLPR